MQRNDILRTITTCIREVLPSVADSQINAQTSLKDLGANSIDRVDILLGLTEALAIDMPVAEFAGAKTIGEIRDLLESRVEALA